MHMPQHPAEREAERLRTIIETLVLTQPYMTMQDAGPMIFETERRTAALEKQQVETESMYFELPDPSAETGAKFIDLDLNIQRHIRSGNKLQAIKEFRGRTRQGLKEAKDAVELWADRDAGRSRPPASATMSGGTDPRSVGEWIEASFTTDPVAEEVVTQCHAHKKIQAIKALRSGHPGGLGLKEAKEGVEYWIDTFAPHLA